MSSGSRLSGWRIASGAGVLVVLGLLGARLLPLYLHNFELQRFVEKITQRVENHTKSDDLLRTWILEKAAALDLPVTANDVHVMRSPEGMRIEVRYAVRVDLPLYTVNLHFYPGAGSR